MIKTRLTLVLSHLSHVFVIDMRMLRCWYIMCESYVEQWILPIDTSKWRFYLQRQLTTVSLSVSS